MTVMAEWDLDLVPYHKPESAHAISFDFKDPLGDRVGVELLFNSVEFGVPRQVP